MLRSISAIAAVPIALAAIATPARTQSAEEMVLIQRAIDRGTLIYAYDQAAWHGTDDMLTKIKQPETKIAGWIVDGPAATPTLIFYDRDRDDPKSVYVAQFRDDKLVSSRVLTDRDDRSLSPERKRMIAARIIGGGAIGTDPATFACSNKSFNTVVLPPEQPGGPILVYVLTPQTEAGKIPFGGHFRVEIGADGKAGKPRGFTRACLSMPIPPKSQKASAIGVSHRLDPVPTEIHVFSSYAAGMPLVVMFDQPTKRAFWVDKGSIRLMRDDELRRE